MFKDFKEFAMRGNVVDMAIGIVIGAAFGTIVKSFVDDVLMPPIGLLLGNVDFSNLFVTLKEGSQSRRTLRLPGRSQGRRGRDPQPGSLHQHHHQLYHHSLCRVPGD